MEFPNVIFGIGGAGKEMLFTLFQQEWLLKKLIEDRISGKIDRKIHAIVIDTAVGEYPDDIKNKEYIEKKIGSILQKMETYLSPSDVIDIDIICIPEKINVGRVSDLIALDVAKKVKSSEIIKSIFELDKVVWWLEDADEGLSGWFNALKVLDPSIETEFTRGVYRKRAIGKALFYRLLAEGKLLEVSPEKVAILVGLGGGTGSGIFIDLATYIYKKYHGAVPIDLFAVLPTKEELDDEKANAFAALTELEYQRLKDRRIFQSIILLPFDPTGWVVSKAQALKEKVKEFDTVVSYIFYNFYVAGGVGGADLFNKIAPLKYAQFLLATGTIVKYEIENLFKIKNLVKSSVEAIDRFTYSRKNVNDVLSIILSDFEKVLGRSEKIPPKQDYDYLNSIIEKLELWNYKALDVLRYSAIEEVRETVRYNLESVEEEVKSKNNFDALVRYIEICEKVLDDIKSKPEFQPKDEVDRQLPEVLYKAMRELKRTSNMVRLCSNINFDEKLRRFIEKLVKNDAPSGAEESEFERYVQSIEGEILSLESKIRQLEESLDGLERERKEIRDDVSNFILTIDKDLNEAWEVEQIRKTAGKDLDMLSQYINEFIASVRSKFVEVKPDDKYVKNEKEWLNRVEFSEIENKIREICLRFGLLDRDIKLETEIVECVRKIMLALYYFNMKEYYKHKTKKSRFRRKKYEEWMRTFENKFSDVLDEIKKYKFSIYYDSSGLPESINLRDVIVMELNEKRDSYIYELSEKINRKFDIVLEEEIIHALEMSEGRTQFKNAVEERMIEKIVNERKIDKRKIEFENQIENLKNRLARKQEVLDALKNFSNQYHLLRKNISEAVLWWNRFLEYIREANEKIEERIVWDKEVHTYISKVPPDSSMVGALGGTLENLTLDTVLETDKVSGSVADAEIKKIVSKCKTWVDRISSDETYNGISLPYIEYQTPKGKGRWSPTIVYLCINDGKTIIKVLDEIESDLKDSVNHGLSLIDKGDIKLFPNSEASGPFEVAVLLYIAPVFLEYIGNIGGDRGYKRYYDRKKERVVAGRKIPNILHHSLMLEKGRIVRRTDLIDLREAAELAWKEWDEGEDVSEEILKYHKEIQIGGAE